MERPGKTPIYLGFCAYCEGALVFQSSFELGFCSEQCSFLYYEQKKQKVKGKKRTRRR